MDHCFPWSVWPCGDLWNLLPTHRTVNQKEKGSRLPSDRLLRAAHDRILGWWHDAYRADPDHPLADRFMLEAAVSLPGLLTAETDLDGCYSALELQRLRLSQNQQAPGMEWREVPLNRRWMDSRTSLARDAPESADQVLQRTHGAGCGVVVLVEGVRQRLQQRYVLAGIAGSGTASPGASAESRRGGHGVGEGSRRRTRCSSGPAWPDRRNPHRPRPRRPAEPSARWPRRA